MSITIKSNLGKYSVNIIKKINQKNLNKNNDFYIVDTAVYKIFLKKKLNKNFVLVNSSEKNKDYFEIGKILKKLILLGIKRNSNLIAIGGGIIQDITGFISSIIFRGINWTFYPTTLLAQGDSCIGGKTSVNFGIIKNQLGNFYPPKKIYLYSNFLKGLKEKDIMSGFGELAHYYLISGKTDWKLFNKYFENFLKDPTNFSILEKVAFKSLKIKKKIIKKNKFDKGLRLILNYGHSFGHAIEKLTNHQIPHGLAVAHGMNIANFFSYKLKLMKYEEFKQIEKTLKKIVDLKQINNMKVYKFVKILKQDKKNLQNNFKLILSKGVGKMLVKNINDDKIVTRLIKEYLAHEK